MRKSLATFVFLLSVALLRSAPGQDRGGSPPEEPPRRPFLHERIWQLDREVGKLLRKQRDAEGPKQTILAAKLNLRLIARTLLRTGRDAGKDGAVAILYGHTVANHADELADAFDKAKSDARALAKLAAFNDRAGEAATGLRSAAAEAVDAYLQEVFSPLRPYLQAVGEPAPATTWVGATGEQGLPSAADLDALEKRVRSVELPSSTREELLTIVGFLRRGRETAALRDRAAAYHQPLRDAVAAAEALQIGWLAKDPAAKRLHQELRTALLFLHDPRTRSTGAKRLAALQRELSLAEQIDRLADTNLRVTQLRRGLVRAWRVEWEGRPSLAKRYRRALRRFADLALRYRRLDSFPSGLRSTAQAIRKRYEQTESKLLTRFVKAVQDPTGEALSGWLSALDTLSTHLTRLEWVARLPDRVKEVRSRTPGVGSGLYTTLRSTVRRLTSREEQAADRLRRFTEQFHTAYEMPLEKRLRAEGPLDDSLTTVLGSSVNELLKRVDKLQRQWAQAWARGSDPSEALDSLALVHRLLRSARDAMLIRDLEGLTEVLDRWAAWEVGPGKTLGVLKVLRARVRRGTQLAARGNWPSLKHTMNQIEAERALPLLVGRLAVARETALRDLPTGPVSLLNQGLHPPAHALSTDRRRTLAAISVHLAEAAHAKEQKKKGLLDKHLAYAGALARRVGPDDAGRSASSSGPSPASRRTHDGEEEGSG